MALINLDERQRLLEQDLDKVVSELPKATAPRIEGWNDAKLMQLRRHLSFDKTCRERSSLKRILIRFYQLYFNGTLDNDDNIVGVVTEACSLARDANKSLWPDELYTLKSFYKSPSSSASRLTVEGTLDSPQVSYLTPTMSEVEKQKYAGLTQRYTLDNSKEFKVYIIKILDEIDPAGTASDRETALVRLTAFLALTLWRAATKNQEQLSNAFLKTQYKTNLTALAGWSADKPFCPPCITCIKLCVASLQKGLPTTGQMFVLLASQYVLSRRAETEESTTAGILSAAVLTHTARNGLGIIQLLEHATTITRQKWTELCKLSYLNITADSWDLIKRFFLTYLHKDNLEYGYNWARIINDGYLRDYSPKEMMPLAAIFAGIIEQQQGPGIWSAEWAKGFEGQLSEMREYGRTIFEATKPTLDSIVASGTSQAILQKAKMNLASRYPLQSDAAVLAGLDI